MCLILRGILSCEYNSPSIKRLQIADQYGYSGYTMNTDEIIDSFNSVPLQVELEQDFNGSSQNEKLTNSTIQSQTLTLTQDKMDYSKRLTLRDLRDRKSQIVFQDKNGEYQFVGEQGAYLKEAQIDNNQSTNGYTLQIEAISRNSARQLTEVLGAEVAGTCPTCKCSDQYFVPVFSQTTSLADTQYCMVGSFGGTL